MVLTHFFTFPALLRNILSHAIDFFTIYGYNGRKKHIEVFYGIFNLLFRRPLPR